MTIQPKTLPELLALNVNRYEDLLTHPERRRPVQREERAAPELLMRRFML